MRSQVTATKAIGAVRRDYAEGSAPCTSKQKKLVHQNDGKGKRVTRLRKRKGIRSDLQKEIPAMKKPT